MKFDQITISFHDNVPAFVEAEMDRLYQNIGSSMAQFRAYGESMDDVCTYVARNGEHPVAIFLFRRKQGKIHVMNEVIRIDHTEIKRFADAVFKHFNDVHVVLFKAIETDVGRLPFPYQRFNCLEDIAMDLPETPEKYLAGLGKNTRRNIKRYTDRLMRSFPSTQFEAYEKEAVESQFVREIIELNRARMSGKNKVSIIDDAEARHISSLVHECGLVGVVRINGRIRAGAISYRVGDCFYLNVLAHDPHYDDYWIGILCCYMTIRECIKRGGREFHFLWGRYDYKFVLGASQRDLDTVVVYRSRLSTLTNADMVLQTAWKGYVRQMKLWLKYSNGPLPKMIGRMVKRVADARGKVVRPGPIINESMLSHTPKK
ncbi:MAG TPA: GNAT family N-acetyltransferase [Noviherbaspirillum sp.]|jgi:hypothetical protein|uniref:GNAT family N-acetyltransferase n=1 Tax=Noviherbaspirillum sp. TaxID=1926288 RepID=UPI002DDD6D21|nr:GNAT family N-acetyltransferase [Noviherbaspirillum sp.]HEV2613013.1 GNAT family N-acetyltransferase [Noviherbaspirillum sp.]